MTDRPFSAPERALAHGQLDQDDVSGSNTLIAGDQTPAAEEDKFEHDFNEQTFYVPVKQVLVIFLTLGLIDFVALMDQTTLAASLQVIGQDLNAGAQTSLISSSYFLTSTACQLLYGRFSDVVGRKPLLLILLVIFFIGALGASLAPDYITLVAFRALGGIGGGGLMTVAQIIVSDVVPLRQRGKYQGILGALVALANGVGPVIGGALTDRTVATGGWRNIFRLSLPISVLGFLCVMVALPLKKVEGDWSRKMKAIDWAGSFLSLAAATLIVLGFTWAGGTYSWVSAHVLATLISGLVLAVVFCLWQWKGDRPYRPALMPLHIFKVHIVCGASITQFINGWLFVSQVYLIPQLYQIVYGYDAVKSGLMLIPLTVVQTALSTISGLLITWTGRYRELLLLGWACWATGLGLISTLQAGSGVDKQIGYTVFTGIGVGLTLQPSLIAIQGAVPRKTMAVVTAMRNFVRNLGGAIGLALSGTIVRSFLSTDLADSAQAGIAQPEVQEAFRNGFRLCFLVMASLATGGFVTALFLLRHKSVDRSDDSDLKEQVRKELAEKKAAKALKRARECVVKTAS
ncbi:hypothetical protein OC842_002371 [Tilletia horrida]|uniref:Major facilitator superfamily (MFS) profile domain-containing protein n=1 Tax=Tilletia horrida TaxID=155126 RepID=A0AAN6JS91_9BASI|nr:hypothetical protein OC842_002371 [Tilletia horrida]